MGHARPILPVTVIYVLQTRASKSLSKGLLCECDGVGGYFESGVVVTGIIGQGAAAPGNSVGAHI